MLLNWLNKRLKNRDEQGTTLIELVIAIPIMAITSGFILLILAQSTKINLLNQAMSEAGVAVQHVVETAQNARNCYELEQSLSNFRGLTDNSKIWFSSGIDNHGGNCVSGEIMNISVWGYYLDDNRLLYRATTNVFISR